MTMREVGYSWKLREIAATRGIFNTSDLHPRLEDRGIRLSTSQVYRLVTGIPERLSLQVLAALCDILDCTPADLIEPYAAAKSSRSRAVGGNRPGPRPLAEDDTPVPRRARIVPDTQ